MLDTLSRKITDLLLKNSLITEKELQEALSQVETEGISLRRLLVSSGKIDEKAWIGLMSQEFRIPPLNLSKYKMDPAIVRLIPEELVKKNQLMAISKLGDTLVVAVVDPLDVMLMDDLKNMTGCKIELVLVSERDLERAFERYYGDAAEKLAQMIEESGEDLEGRGVAGAVEKESFKPEELEEESQQGPILRLVDAIITEGLKRRASDIHVEPYHDRVRVRYRVDGRLQEANVLPKKIQNAVLARLKLISGVDITEFRIPQDGRFKIKFQNREIDFRVSFLPISHGGKVVMRVLDRRNLVVGLDQLGMNAETLKKFQEAIAKPFGMVLVTGPTGSGKTTTLYSILSQLNVPERNIITIEDPVEYQIDGITQIQIKPEINFNFASGLRSILRQSPDVVMIGEIRDFETADIAVKASLTGQLVLSTLHTNDAAGAMTRLVDMGVEPFLISSSLILVVAQRLCRKICPRCKEPLTPDLKRWEKMGIDPSRLQGGTLYHGRGCPQCHQTGFWGRVAIMEALVIEDRIRERIISKVSSDEIKREAIEEQKMKILREDGLQKCFQGITTLEEVVEITTEE